MAAAGRSAEEAGCPDGYEVQHSLKAETIWLEEHRPKDLKCPRLLKGEDEDNPHSGGRAIVSSLLLAEFTPPNRLLTERCIVLGWGPFMEFKKGPSNGTVSDCYDASRMSEYYRMSIFDAVGAGLALYAAEIIDILPDLRSDILKSKPHPEEAGMKMTSIRDRKIAMTSTRAANEASRDSID